MGEGEELDVCPETGAEGLVVGGWVGGWVGWVGGWMGWVDRVGRWGGWVGWGEEETRF